MAKLAVTGEACLTVHWFKKIGVIVAKIIRMKNEKRPREEGVCLRDE